MIFAAHVSSLSAVYVNVWEATAIVSSLYLHSVEFCLYFVHLVSWATHSMTLWSKMILVVHISSLIAVCVDVWEATAIVSSHCLHSVGFFQYFVHSFSMATHSLTLCILIKNHLCSACLLIFSCTPGPRLVRFSLVRFSLVCCFKTLPKYLTHADYSFTHAFYI